MQLFKYCKREHMDALLSKGSLRIGTLFDWRKQNQYGELVFDPNEGFIEISGNIIFYDHRFISDVLVEGSVSSSDEIDNQLRHFKNEILHTHNFFTFSAASSYSEQDHHTWYEREGYDTCYTIHSPRLFFRAISEELWHANFLLHDKINYFDETKSNNVFEGTFHPALLKMIRFGSQDEVRALWRPNDVKMPISPVVVEKSNAHRYCSAFRTLAFRST